MNKTVVVLLVGFIVLILFIKVGSQFQSSRSTFWDKHNTTLTLDAKVTKITKNKNRKTIFISIGEEGLEYVASDADYQRITKVLEVGDSLHKEANNLQLYIYRKQSLLDSFQFQCYTCEE